MITPTDTFKRRLNLRTYYCRDIADLDASAVILMPNTHRRRRRDETVESRRVGGVYTNSQLVGVSFVVSSVRTHASAVVTQFTIFCADK